MKDFLVLKLLDRLAFLFRSLKIDYEQMRKILQIKLILDGRRIPTIFEQYKNDKKDKKGKNSNQFINSLSILVVFSFMLIPFVVMDGNIYFQTSIFFGVYMFFMMTSMVSDFSSVLLDLKDRNILYPKPIEKRTISAVKFVHILIYFTYITIALSGIPLIVSLFSKGVIFFLLLILNIILINLFTIAITALVYIVILKFFDSEKLKDIINYVQIGLSFVLVIGYMLIMQTFDLIDIRAEITPSWWHGLIPPMWNAAIVEMMINGNFQFIIYLLACFGLVMPIISLIAYIKLLPTFEHNLQKIVYFEKAEIKKSSQLKAWFLKQICRKPDEQAVYKFLNRILKHEKDFKLRMYPFIAFSLLFPIFFIFIFNEGDINIDLLRSSRYYITIYFSFMMIPTVLLMLRYSSKYKGAWIFKVAPLDNLQPIFSGTIKVFLIKLYLPVHLILSVLWIIFFGIDMIPHLIIVFVNALIYTLIIFVVTKKYIPFSQPMEFSNQTINGSSTFGLTLISALFALIHFLVTINIIVMYVYIILSVILIYFSWRKICNVPWGKISG